MNWWRELKEWWWCVTHGYCPKHLLALEYDRCRECGAERSQRAKQKLAALRARRKT